jgi:hypothetical protein
MGLLGDAGVFKDYVTGDGMTEALPQARSVAIALSSPERWWRARDVAAVPFYLFGKIQGQAGAVTALDALVLARSAENPRLRERFAPLLAHDMSPRGGRAPSQISGWAARATLGGELRVLGDLRRQAR